MRRAVVVGRARGALDEYAAACTLCAFDDVLVVGAMGVDFPDRIDHLVSFHAELFCLWAEKRAVAGYSPAVNYWGAIYRGRRLGERVKVPAPLRYVECIGGSSGFMAVHVALDALDVDRVVLAGVPMDAAAAHYGSDQPWDEADKYWGTWLGNVDRLRGRVRSMSGRTRNVFGEPDKEWLLNE